MRTDAETARESGDQVYQQTAAPIPIELIEKLQVQIEGRNIKRIDILRGTVWQLHGEGS